MNDPFDPYLAIHEVEFAELHLRLVDQFLVAVLGADGLAKVNEALGLPDETSVVTDDGRFDAATFIRVATIKLRLLRRLVHEAMVRSVTDPGPVKRNNAKESGVHHSVLDTARRWLKGASFTLPEVRVRYPHADPEAHQYGAAGRPPVFGAHDTFDDLDDRLADFED